LTDINNSHGLVYVYALKFVTDIVIAVDSRILTTTTAISMLFVDRLAIQLHYDDSSDNVDDDLR